MGGNLQKVQIILADFHTEAEYSVRHQAASVEERKALHKKFLTASLRRWALKPQRSDVRGGVYHFPRHYTHTGGCLDCLATGGPQSYLTRRKFSVNCLFVMATIAQMMPAEFVADLDFPQREAAFFYGLFLRGHSPEQLRRDIEVPPSVLARWHKDAEREPQLRSVFARMVEYRRHVLAIFDLLIGSDRQHRHLQ
jgi:hypothetical protein